MQPYSIDLRVRVLAALERGMSRAEAVATFEVSLASLKRWLKARRETGSLSARQATGGPKRTITPDHYDQLRSQVQEAPDASLYEHAAMWNATHPTTLSPSTIGRAIRQLELTRKKSH